MSPRKVMVSLVALGIAGFAAGAFRHDEAAGLGVATLNAAEPETVVLRGEPRKTTRGSLTAWVPAELAVSSGAAFDVVVHFHGSSRLQEANAREAGLAAVVVSANEGMGTTPYARAFEESGSLDRALDLAIEAVRESGRLDGSPAEPRVRRVALSSWSAGGAAVRQILGRARDAERVDAVLLADGIFTRYESRAKKTLAKKPLEPFVELGRQALEGKKLMVVTHTAIETPGYPNVKECTDAILEALDLPTSDVAVYSLDRGELHVRGSDGTGPDDHTDQIRALDEAYAMLRERWRHRD